jgi:hypothetical protein
VRRLNDRPDRHGIRSHRLRDERHRQDDDRHDHEDHRQLRQACGENSAERPRERLVDGGSRSRDGKSGGAGTRPRRRPDGRAEARESLRSKLRRQNEYELRRERLVVRKLRGVVHLNTPRPSLFAVARRFPPRPGSIRRRSRNGSQVQPERLVPGGAK